MTTLPFSELSDSEEAVNTIVSKSGGKIKFKNRKTKIGETTVNTSGKRKIQLDEEENDDLVDPQNSDILKNLKIQPKITIMRKPMSNSRDLNRNLPSDNAASPQLTVKDYLKTYGDYEQNMANKVTGSKVLKIGEDTKIKKLDDRVDVDLVNGLNTEDFSEEEGRNMKAASKTYGEPLKFNEKLRRKEIVSALQNTNLDDDNGSSEMITKTFTPSNILELGSQENQISIVFPFNLPYAEKLTDINAKISSLKKLLSRTEAEFAQLENEHKKLIAAQRDEIAKAFRMPVISNNTDSA